MNLLVKWSLYNISQQVSPNSAYMRYIVSVVYVLLNSRLEYIDQLIALRVYFFQEIVFLVSESAEIVFYICVCCNEKRSHLLHGDWASDTLKIRFSNPKPFSGGVNV